MGIRAAVRAVIEIERGISITEPRQLSIKQHYNYLPRQNEELNSCPCTLHNWTLVEIMKNPGGWYESVWDIRIQLAIDTNEQDLAADEATAFMDAFVIAFSNTANATLSSTVSNHTLTGASPTLVGLNWGGKPYVGLDLHLQVNIKEVLA